MLGGGILGDEICCWLLDEMVGFLGYGGAFGLMVRCVECDHAKRCEDVQFGLEAQETYACSRRTWHGDLNGVAGWELMLYGVCRR